MVDALRVQKKKRIQIGVLKMNIFCSPKLIPVFDVDVMDENLQCHCKPNAHEKIIPVLVAGCMQHLLFFAESAYC